ncbi:MAG: ABC transporter permease [Thermomicrobiales bacterium]|nr:ABC transporter permease [Thermomicrobiales bacterium]
MFIGLLAAAITSLLSLAVGLLAGFRGGIVDELLMRFTDTMMALPSLFVILVLAAMTTPSVPELVVMIALLQWMYPARLVRGETISLRHREYVQAAKASGASSLRMMLRHILPGVVPTLLIAATLAFAWALLTESALSYLGVGVRPPQASWGNMLADAQMMLFLAPELAVYPGLCIVLTVLSINLLGDRLRDALDPRSVVRP